MNRRTRILLGTLSILVALLLSSMAQETGTKAGQKTGAKAGQTATEKSGAKPEQKAAAKAGDPKAGAEVYKQKCVACHGADGIGNTTMGKNMKVRDLTSADVQKQTDSELFDVIARGKGKMPGYEKSLGHDKIHDVVAYIRELGKKRS